VKDARRWSSRFEVEMAVADLDLGGWASIHRELLVDLHIQISIRICVRYIQFSHTFTRLLHSLPRSLKNSVGFYADDSWQSVYI
jgi:hypothetical protein